MESREGVATELFLVGDGSVFAVKKTVSNAGRSHGFDLSGFLPPLGWIRAEESTSHVTRHFEVDTDSEESLLRFESDFGLYVAEKLDGYVAVHSALLLVGDAVVIVPGPSHRGKSTLALAAVDAAHTVLSDEYTLISEKTGRVRGWSRPIRRRNPDGTITRVPIPADNHHSRPTHVIELTFQQGSEVPLAVETVSPGDVALSLLANTVCAQSRPESSLRAAAEVSRQVQGYQGTRGEAREALEELVLLVG